ncbi:hypothetical protein [Enterococcus sp. JM9B]|uniref:hypothetical protein n=1 Tax=Enterococcus sp. JM9B TaxID=1857216 RepID=UPI0013750A68|nr:hypothetical protein [Enterococcus sp. JM9B]KAF1303399.1 hypothetical protein BAU16_04935 [Enterococcus sp. JM9B]
MELFGGQAVFLADYKKAAKNPKAEKEIVAEVMEQLNDQLAKSKPSLYFRLSPAASLTGKEVVFPFTKELYSEDQEATISTRLCYGNAEYRAEIDTDEQL